MPQSETLSLKLTLATVLICLSSGLLFAQNVKQAQFLSTNSPGTTSIAAFKGFAGQPIVTPSTTGQSGVAFAPSFVRIIRQLTIQIPSGSETPGLVPLEFALGQNFPNPFNPTTVIPFTLDKSSGATLVIYNLLGQQVRTFDLSQLTAGEYELAWDGKNSHGMSVPSGQYFARLSHESRVQVRKLTLIK